MLLFLDGRTIQGEAASGTRSIDGLDISGEIESILDALANAGTDLLNNLIPATSETMRLAKGMVANVSGDILDFMDDWRNGLVYGGCSIGVPNCAIPFPGDDACRASVIEQVTSHDGSLCGTGPNDLRDMRTCGGAGFDETLAANCIR